MVDLDRRGVGANKFGKGCDVGQRGLVAQGEAGSFGSCGRGTKYEGSQTWNEPDADQRLVQRCGKGSLAGNG